MDQSIIHQLKQGLNSSLGERFGMNSQEVEALSAGALNALTDVIKSYVLKNGTGELERIMLGQESFTNSPIRKEIVASITESAKRGGMENNRASEVSSHASDHLVGDLVRAFASSGKSQDQGGIADFFGIDRNILKMANSPAAKIFGKFF